MRNRLHVKEMSVSHGRHVEACVAAASNQNLIDPLSCGWQTDLGVCFHQKKDLVVMRRQADKDAR
jgi:hypothetical protein